MRCAYWFWLGMLFLTWAPLAFAGPATPTETIPNPVVTLEVNDASLPAIATQLGGDTGVDLMAAAGAGRSGDAPVKRSFALRDLPLQDVLSKVATAFDCRWYYRDGFFCVVPNPGASPAPAVADSGGAADPLDEEMRRDPERITALVSEATRTTVERLFEIGFELTPIGKDRPRVRFEKSLTPRQLALLAGEGLRVHQFTPEQQDLLRRELADIYYAEATMALQSLGDVLEPPDSMRRSAITRGYPGGPREVVRYTTHPWKTKSRLHGILGIYQEISGGAKETK